MIEFPCHCGYALSVPSEMAGSVVQCPQCSRLNDVPTADELTHMDADGALQLTPPIQRTDDPQARIQQLHRAFTRDKYDQDGNPIDLRPTFDDIIGHDDGTIPLADEIKAELPKYDPETGELVRPLDVKPVPAPPPGPHPALQPEKNAKGGRVVNYASAPLVPPITFKNLTFRLFQPVNIFVMLIILIAHVIAAPINVMMTIGIFFVAPLWIIAAMFFIGHYGCVIEDIGPCDKDELPRPMRDFSLSEDIWRPFTHIAGAAMICFSPVFFILFKDLSVPSIAMYALALAGAFFFPAVLLTLSTSGTVLNLRPDRVMGVIGIIGARYFLLITALVIALPCYYFGLWRINFDIVLIFVPASVAAANSGALAWWLAPWFTYPMLLIAIYFSHWFCAALGVLYRAHQPQFPWILQHHIPTKLAERNRPSPQRTANANSAKVRAKMAEPLAPRLPR